MQTSPALLTLCRRPVGQRSLSPVAAGTSPRWTRVHAWVLRTCCPTRKLFAVSGCWDNQSHSLERCAAPPHPAWCCFALLWHTAAKPPHYQVCWAAVLLAGGCQCSLSTDCRILSAKTWPVLKDSPCAICVPAVTSLACWTSGQPQHHQLSCCPDMAISLPCARGQQPFPCTPLLQASLSLAHTSTSWHPGTSVHSAILLCTADLRKLLLEGAVSLSLAASSQHLSFQSTRAHVYHLPASGPLQEP